MTAKRIRSKKEIVNTVSIDTFIERLRKARALNCSPSYLGVNGYVSNRVFNRSHLFVKFS